MKFISRINLMRYFTNHRVSYLDVVTITLLLQHKFPFFDIKSYVQIPFNTLDDLMGVLFRRYPQLKSKMNDWVNYEGLCEFWLKLFQLKDRLLTVVSKGLIYPVLLFLTSMMTVVFLQGFFLPQITQFDHSDISFYFVVLRIMHALFWLFILIALIILISIVYLNQSVYRAKLLHQKLLKISILQWNRLNTLLFAIGLNHLMALGISTKHAIEIIIEWKQWPIVHSFAYAFLNHLEEGKSMDESLMLLECSSIFLRYIQKGMLSHQLIQCINEYIELETQLLVNEYTKLMNVIKFASYLLVVAVLLIAYQCISLPLLSILEQL